MRIFSIILLTALCALAQEAPRNYAIQYTGDNTNGVPFYWPAAIKDIGTNTTAPNGWFFFTQDALAQLTFTNAPALRQIQAAKTEQTRLAKVQIASQIMSDVVNKAQAIQDGWATNSAQRITLLKDLKASIDSLAVVNNKLQNLIRDDTDL